MRMTQVEKNEIVAFIANMHSMANALSPRSPVLDNALNGWDAFIASIVVVG